MKRLLLSVLALSLAGPALAEQRLNPTTGQYEVIRPGDELQFNVPGGTWGYAAPGARPELNRSTLQWEFPGGSQHRPYDPVPSEYRRHQRDVEIMERDQSRSQYPRY